MATAKHTYVKRARGKMSSRRDGHGESYHFDRTTDDHDGRRRARFIQVVVIIAYVIAREKIFLRETNKEKTIKKNKK